MRLDEEEYRLHLTVHHLIHDGVSIITIFVPELLTLYQGFLSGTPAVLPDLPIQYADYATWQRQWLQGETLEKLLAYWRQQLAGELSSLQLPTDRSRSGVDSFRGAIECFSLPKPLTDALETLGRQQGVTFFMTLVAGFAVLLQRYTDQDDILVGTFSGSRPAEVAGILGYFLNPVLLRTDLSGNPTFRELLGRVREVTLGALSNDALPFNALMDHLKPRRELGRIPLFQVGMSLEPPLPVLLPGWSLAAPDIDTGVSYLDLYVDLYQGATGVAGRCRYNDHLFNGSSIRGMLTHWHGLLEAAASNPERPISQLRVSPVALQLTACGSGVKPPKAFLPFERAAIEQSIASRFEEQVAKHPAKVAIRSGQHEWTYTQLNAEADRVAEAVANHQADDCEGLVALLLDHDAPMVAAILGVQKAGSGYVPLDPHFPAGRLCSILENAGVRLLVTTDRHLSIAKAIAGSRVQVLNIGRLRAEALRTDGSKGRRTGSRSPDGVAYVLYTSGSTGRPKGVVQNHRNVLHFIRNYTNNLRINETDRLSLISSYGVDAAVMDMFGALLNGATLFPFDLREEGFVGLREQLNRHKITIYHSTPTIFRHFIGTLPPHDILETIRLVVLGGEEVTSDDVQAYREHFGPNCVPVNGLGLTESTVTLQNFIDMGTPLERRSVPVGYPVEDTEIWLLNRFGEPGQIYGEIGIRSAHVALGYLNEAELTRAAFLPDPDGGERRVYRTGDMGRLLPDGALAFAGRRDLQVKIRGFRVEIGEIQATLLQCAMVKDAVVVAQDGAEGDKRLIAYVVTDQRSRSTSALREFVAERLPEYMVPEAFVLLDTIPLTPSGKLDRRSLLARNERSTPLSLVTRTFVAPATDTEKRLAQIMTGLIEVQQIGTHDNLFDLGVHSLIAVRLFAAIEQTFGVRLPISSLFQSPTLEQLARIVNRLGAPAPSPIVAIQTGGSQLPFFCVHGVDGEALWYTELARALGSDQPFYGLQGHGLQAALGPSPSVEAIAAHYIAAVRTIAPTGPYLLGGFSLGGTIAFEMARQLEAAGDAIGCLVIFDSDLPGGSRGSVRPMSVVGGFLANLPYWLMDAFFHTRPIANLARARRNVVILRQWLESRIGGTCPPPRQLLYFAELAKLGLDEKLMWFLFDAAQRYIPGTYAGRVTLFRARSQPLFRAHRELNWPRFATGGVDVRIVPGSHSRLLTSPWVRAVAVNLDSCLRELEGIRQK